MENKGAEQAIGAIVPSGQAPYFVSSGAAKVANLDADKSMVRTPHKS